MDNECHTGMEGCSHVPGGGDTYIYIYIHMCICMYVYMYVCIYIYIYSEQAKVRETEKTRWTQKLLETCVELVFSLVQTKRTQKLLGTCAPSSNREQRCATLTRNSVA